MAEEEVLRSYASSDSYSEETGSAHSLVGTCPSGRVQGLLASGPLRGLLKRYGNRWEFDAVARDRVTWSELLDPQTATLFIFRESYQNQQLQQVDIARLEATA